MSSERFPGKVLAPFRGRPLLAHVTERVAGALPLKLLVLATSAEASDDPLACYAGKALGLRVFRGPLEDVVRRFQLCLAANPCEWFFRVCADGPLYDPGILKRMLALAGRTDLDLVTNVFPRSFPRGQSAEMIRAKTFSALKPEGLTLEQREHATKVFYDRPARFRILNIDSGRPELSGQRLTVDSPQDLLRLESVAPRAAAKSA